ncbi:MAG: isoprenylcysteine carboxylmethyltransferase family protein [Dehalococcoidales bacterium]|nr:isoprenylcysteine carboxylmethyltransferase family protein [Dehalococcoidales bacterium]
MVENLFTVLYLSGMVVGSAIRAWYGIKFRQDRKAIYRQEGLLVLSLASLWGIAILLPFFNLFTDWLDFATYPLPGWAGWPGVAIFGVALWLLWRSHADLGRNWSVAAEVRERQTLITSGVFKYMRHPMYSAHWLWGIAQALLVHNWISGLASLAIFIPLYLLRVPREEKVMLHEFGDEYRQYMHGTGRVLPRLWR